LWLVIGHGKASLIHMSSIILHCAPCGCWITGWGHAVSCSRPDSKLWWNGNEQTKGPDFELWSLMVCFPVEKFGVLKFGSLWRGVQNVGGDVGGANLFACRQQCQVIRIKLLGTRTKLHAQVLFSFSSFFRKEKQQVVCRIYSLTHVRVDVFILD
jgi:hypothetical protein